MRYRHHDFAPHNVCNKLLQKSSPDDPPRVHPAAGMRLSSQSWSQISAQGMVSGQRPRRWRRRACDHRKAAVFSEVSGGLTGGGSAQKHPGEVRLRVIHSAAAAGALLRVRWHAVVRGGSSSLHAQGVYKCCFLPPTNLSESAPLSAGRRVNRWI